MLKDTKELPTTTLSSRKTTNTNVFLFIDILFLNYTTDNQQPTTIFIVD